jgi:putative hydrolase of the HAD superfamily
MRVNVKAVLWDFGGVLTASPFEAFDRFERANGYPRGFIRGINATNPDSNAWARLERGEVTLAEFDRLFGDEAAAAGHPLAGRRVLELLAGDVRPEMVAALRRCREQFKNACLTNNFVRADPAPAGAAREEAAGLREPPTTELLALFDLVVESSRLGIRKPHPNFYTHALRELEVEAREAVFLDDLGVNLKPARALGMHTIKVVTADQALRELEAVLGIPLRERA